MHCLSQVVRICTDASMFLNQLHKFDHQLAKFHSLSSISRENFLSIQNRFLTTLTDLNIYYKNEFLPYYSSAIMTLSHEYQSSNSFDQQEKKSSKKLIAKLQRLDTFLARHTRESTSIFSCLQELSMHCYLCLNYRQYCSNIDFDHRFSYVRINIMANLFDLKSHLESFLQRLNVYVNEQCDQSFSSHAQSSIKSRKIQLDEAKLLRTIFLWLLIILIFGIIFTRSQVPEY